MQQVDYRFEDHGSIWLCQPLTGDARENLDQACESCEDFYIRWGNALVVEPRFVGTRCDAIGRRRVDSRMSGNDKPNLTDSHFADMINCVSSCAVDLIL